MQLIDFFDRIIAEGEANQAGTPEWTRDKDFCKQLRRAILGIETVTGDDPDLMVVDCFSMISLICSMETKESPKRILRLAKSLSLAQHAASIIHSTLMEAMNDQR